MADLRRQGGRFPKDAWKRGAGQWPKVNPRTGRTGGKGLASKQGGLARGTKPGVGRGGRMLKGVGGIGAAVGIGAAGASAIQNAQRLDADLRAGRITQAQFNRAQATNALEAGGTLLAIKKLTPTGMAGSLLVGTDPISLGVDAVGDLINGTNNAERAIQNVGKALEGHGRGLAKLATDPVGWANEAGRNIETELKKVEKDLNNAARDVGKALDQAGKDVGKFFQGIFG